jgi:ABC-2 type transport system permease protein
VRVTNLYRLGLKELASLRYDPVMVFLIVYGFTFAIIAPAKGVRLELSHASVGVVDEDRSRLSRQIVDGLRPPYFKPPVPIGLDRIDADMDRGRYTFVIDIPPDFQADLTAGREPSIQVNVDATAMTQAGAGARYIETIVREEVRAFVAGHRFDPPQLVDAVVRVAFNPNTQSDWFLGAMQLINMSTLLGIVLTGAALIREREHGTVEHLLVMPLTPTEIMLAKVWSNGLVIVVAATLSLLVMVRGVLEVPIAGSIPLFVLGLGVYLFAVTAIGIFLATLARSMPQFGLLSIPVFLVLYMLSGANTPRESMPEGLQTLMQLSPTTHIVDLAQSVLFRGAGLGSVWPDLLATAGIGTVFFVTALARFRKTVSLTQL